MIREDRLELNDRFIKVFKLLEERGVIVKNDRGGKGMGDFAEKILGNRAYGHIIRAYLNPSDKRCIDYHQAKALCREYGVNETFILDGEGTPFGFDLPEPKVVEVETENYIGNILFTSIEAFAGVNVGSDSFLKEDFEYFSLPGLIGSGMVAFPIKGNSMDPVIKDGDVVICSEISSLDELKDNGIYAIKTGGRMWIKYVQKIKDAKGRVVKLKLISANHLEHDPFEEDIDEYTRLYKVVKRVSNIN